MTHVRHLLIGLASSSAFYSGLAPALGLGEITLHSALNQPLNAEIQLLAVGDDMTTSDIKVALAPADAFNRAGVDRVYFLNDLRFSPLLRGGKSVVRVVSNQPVREPYLNFIVELKRPGGQLLREYTVLLDPPSSSAYSSQAAPVGDQQFTSYAPPRRTPIASRGERYQVASGESLWTIASKLRVDGDKSSLQDLMLDIHALNPDAFSNGDIHRLRAGASLLLPDHARVAEAAPAQPADAAPAQPAAPAQIIPDTAPQQPAEPQVEVLAQIRRVEEEVANRTAENLQLQQDLLTVQNQLKDMMTRMDARDQQIAQLLEQLAQRPAAAPVAPAEPAPQAAAPSAAAQPAPAPATAAAQPAQTEGFWSLWNILMAALLGLLALLLVLFKRKRKPDPQAIAEPVVVVPPVVQASVVEPVEPVVVPRAAEVDVPPPVRAPIAPRTDTSSTDPLDAANIYLAYGRLGEAVSVLRQASQANPQRLDIGFRLLEVLAQKGNVAAFAEEEMRLRQAGFDGARIDGLKAGYPALFAQPAADELEPLESLGPLEDLTLDLDEVPAPAPQQKPQEDDFQLNLDDLSLDADWDLVNPFENASRKKRPGAEADTPTVPEETPEDIFGHDVHSPFAGTMLVEEEGPQEQWLELDELPAESSEDAERFVTNHQNLTKLNLAMAYIEQDDLEAACDILNEVINEGDEEEKQEARELLARIA